MKHNVEFECGEKTCAVEPGVFCRFFGTKSFGSIGFCWLFGEELYIESYEVNGKFGKWTMRCYNCLEGFPNEK